MIGSACEQDDLSEATSLLCWADGKMVEVMIDRGEGARRERRAKREMTRARDRLVDRAWWEVEWGRRSSAEEDLSMIAIALQQGDGDRLQRTDSFLCWVLRSRNENYIELVDIVQSSHEADVRGLSSPESAEIAAVYGVNS